MSLQKKRKYRSNLQWEDVVKLLADTFMCLCTPQTYKTKIECEKRILSDEMWPRFDCYYVASMKLVYASKSFKTLATAVIAAWRPFKCCAYAKNLTALKYCVTDRRYTELDIGNYFELSMLILKTRHVHAPTGSGWCLSCRQQKCKLECKCRKAARVLETFTRNSALRSQFTH